MDHRSVFRRYVAEALARRAGIPLARAAAIVEESQLGALAVGKLNFLSYKGPDYWAELILEQIGSEGGRNFLRNVE
ncbi:hypothetical protein [Anaeroselena agilis]|uniref:Uncharacterized protein n=1 Tax=Anaeroselena agilis TaxID=3063788 RepID=A0ABU3P225_9FIRM|nr:hypothetical protein [Selenomonadales bacterium 4137-cl]